MAWQAFEKPFNYPASLWRTRDTENIEKGTKIKELKITASVLYIF